MTRQNYERYLFAMCGIAGMILGTGGGLVGVALPYINQTSGFSPTQLSTVGAALILARVETRTLFDNFQDFVAMLTAGLTTLFVVGVFLPRIRGRAMMCGLLAGYFVTFALKYLPLPFTKPHFLLFGGIGFAVSVAVAWAMSFILPEKRRDIGAYTIEALKRQT